MSQEAYAQMVERRIRMQNPRPQTPPGMNLAERIMWKRNQMREEQSYRENLPVDPEDISTDIEQYTEEVTNHSENKFSSQNNCPSFCIFSHCSIKISRRDVHQFEPVFSS